MPVSIVVLNMHQEMWHQQTTITHTVSFDNVYINDTLIEYVVVHEPHFVTCLLTCLCLTFLCSVLKFSDQQFGFRCTNWEYFDAVNSGEVIY
jgi:hypothetical protein